jgi:hypothetical protein
MGRRGGSQGKLHECFADSMQSKAPTNCSSTLLWPELAAHMAGVLAFASSGETAFSRRASAEDFLGGGHSQGLHECRFMCLDALNRF